MEKTAVYKTSCETSDESNSTNTWILDILLAEWWEIHLNWIHQLVVNFPKWTHKLHSTLLYMVVNLFIPDLHYIFLIYYIFYFPLLSNITPLKYEFILLLLQPD
jgi:hypothetical protein